MDSNARMTDGLDLAMRQGDPSMQSALRVEGWVTLDLFDADGELKSRREVKNLITDAGDLYYATRAIAAVTPATPSDAGVGTRQHGPETDPRHADCTEEQQQSR